MDDTEIKALVKRIRQELGREGGLKSSGNMTPQARKRRAMKAAKASAAIRAKRRKAIA